MKQFLPTLLGIAALITAAIASDLDTAKIDQLTGLKGKLNEKEGVYKVSFPRNDVSVSVDGGSYRLLWVSGPGPRSRGLATRQW